MLYSFISKNESGDFTIVNEMTSGIYFWVLDKRSVSREDGGALSPKNMLTW